MKQNIQKPKSCSKCYIEIEKTDWGRLMLTIIIGLVFLSLIIINVCSVNYNTDDFFKASGINWIDAVFYLIIFSFCCEKIYEFNNFSYSEKVKVKVAK